MGCEDNDPTEAISWFRNGLRKKFIPIRLMVENYEKSKSGKSK